MACSNWSFQMFCSKWSPQNVCSKFSSSKWCAHNGLLKMVCSKRSAQNGLFTQSSKRLLLVPSHFWPICPVILNFGMHFRPPCERAHCRASYVCAQILIFGPVGPPKCPVILNLEWALWRTVKHFTLLLMTVEEDVMSIIQIWKRPMYTYRVSLYRPVESKPLLQRNVLWYIKIL